MIRTSFNDNWTVGPKPSAFGAVASTPRKNVRLPHDGVRDLNRSADSSNGSHTAFYPGAHLSYEKSFEAPEEWTQKVIVVEFEGVYRDAMVFINGDFAGQRPNGYTAFQIRLDPYLRFGQSNTIRVEARTYEDSRWYGGGGIYRNTWLSVTDPVHISLNGVRVTTPDVDDERAVVITKTDVMNETRHTRTVRVATTITGPYGDDVEGSSAPITLLGGQSGTVHLRHYVREPRRWNLDDPNLYTLRTRIEENSALLDEDHSTFGIRTIQLDPFHGLRINGITVKLRGGCIHHDNGPLGSAAIDRAEERRVQILKAAGYNAIRSSHNNISRAFLDACDRHGMLVWDELSDVWTEGKTSFDYSTAFPEWWERDIEAMVAKDYNHPSVIMYSIGNEIYEVGRPIGSTWGRRIATKIRELDDTRLVTNAINGMVAALDLIEGAAADSDEPFNVNAVIDAMEGLMNDLGASNAVAERTEESHSQLDVSGINYSEAMYDRYTDSHPNRIIVGSETFPPALDRLWALVKQYPHVIGDFAWTAWDYIGETGVGRVVYRDEDSGSFGADYPYLVSRTGTIDITGQLQPLAYWRQIVWGLRSEPYIAVYKPQHRGRDVKIGPWAWQDVVSRWSWNVDPRTPITVDVYSDSDEVELLLNGNTVGRSHVGTGKKFIAQFEIEYQRGTLTAVGYRDGIESGRTVLRSSEGDLELRATVDRDRIQADGTDLAYIDITVTDATGIEANGVEVDVEVSIDGPGELIGFASGNPSTEERFDTDRRTTYGGRVLAVVRPTSTGTITLTARAEGITNGEAVFTADQWVKQYPAGASLTASVD